VTVVLGPFKVAQRHGAVVVVGFAQPRGGKEWGPGGARARARGSGRPAATRHRQRRRLVGLHGMNRGDGRWVSGAWAVMAVNCWAGCHGALISSEFFYLFKQISNRLEMT
jgi:hypothetical protein